MLGWNDDDTVQDTGEPLDPDSLFDPMISPLDAIGYNWTFRVPITKDFCENNGTNEITINYPYPSQVDSHTMYPSIGR
jgi:hypothetical protein